MIALLRLAGYDAPIYLHGAMESITRYYQSRGIELGELRLAKGMKKADLAGTITLAPPWASIRHLDPAVSRSGDGVRLRLDAGARPGPAARHRTAAGDFQHADWDGLTATIEATGAGEIWVTHGQEDALVHWCKTKGLAARPLDLVGYGEEDEHDAAPAEAAAP